MARTIRISLLAGALVLAFGGVAAAQSTRLPVSYQQRPLTLPKGTLRPELAFVFTSYPAPFDDQNRVHFYAGLGAGVTDDFELGAMVMPLRLAPDFEYGDRGFGLPPAVTPWFGHNRPSIYGRYRFVEGEVEVGLDVHFVLPAPKPFQLAVGIPFLFRISDVVRIDTGFYIVSDFDDDTDAFVPLVLAIQATPRFFLGVDTGFYVPGPAIPIGFFMGYTAGDAPTADLKGGVRIVDADAGIDVWQVWFGADFYVFL